MEDEYNYTTVVMPTNPNQLFELLTKIETKLKVVRSETKPWDHQKGKGQHNDSRSESKRDAKASHDLKGVISRKTIPKKVEKNANCAKNVVVHRIHIILLSGRNGLLEANIVKNGKATKPPTSMSIRMLVSNNYGSTSQVPKIDNETNIMIL